MKILALADIHGRSPNIGLLQRELEWADVIILTGDITNFGNRAEAARVLQALVASGKQMLAVPGNCDYPGVAEYLDELGVNIDGRAAMIGEVSFVGLGGSLPGPGITPNELSEAEIEAVLASACEGVPQEDVQILVSHQPPIDSAADRLPNGDHVGSHAVREYIQRVQPSICFTGHIHESRGIGVVDQTQVVNPGPLGTGWCAVAEVGPELGLLELRRIN